MAINDVEKLVMEDIKKGVTPTSERCSLENPEFCAIVKDMQEKNLIEGVTFDVEEGRAVRPIFKSAKITSLGRDSLG
jgi:hypothetical protein